MILAEVQASVPWGVLWIHESGHWTQPPLVGEEFETVTSSSDCVSLAVEHEAEGECEIRIRGDRENLQKISLGRFEIDCPSRSIEISTANGDTLLGFATGSTRVAFEIYLEHMTQAQVVDIVVCR